MAEKPRLDTTRLQKMAQAYWESAALTPAQIAEAQKLAREWKPK